MTKLSNQIHPFHLVDPSPWPLLASVGALSATSGGVMWFHDYCPSQHILETPKDTVTLLNESRFSTRSDFAFKLQDPGLLTSNITSTLNLVVSAFFFYFFFAHPEVE